MTTAAPPALLLETFKLVGEEVVWQESGEPVPFRPNAEGYCLVSVPSGHRGGLYVLYHRLKFLLATGHWPPRVDHRDQDRHNNLLENLRGATHQENMWNSKDRNRDLPRCVYRTRHGTFVSKVTLHGRVHHLGTFATPDEAARAATRFRKRHHGEFFAAP